jgi:uncharacterized surface protein with fasciclin (FAS1) repeats
MVLHVLFFSIFEYLLWNSTVENRINKLGSYTVFAPTNAAFAEIPKKAYGYLVNNTKLLKEVGVDISWK